MPSTALLYFSGQGHTHLMAEALVEGLKQKGIETFSHRISGNDIQDGRWKDPGGVTDALKAADGILMGSPTYMGGIAAQLKCVVDALGGVWFEQGFAGKFAGGFTHSSSPCGEKTATMLYLMTHAAQHGMYWVPNAQLADRYTGQDRGINYLGSHVGVFGQQDIDMSDDATIEISETTRKTCHGYAGLFAEALAMRAAVSG